MYKDYNMQQLMLDIPTAYEPGENHPAYQINQLVESMDFEDNYTTGRYPYDPRLLLKLVLFAYARGIRSGRQIEQFADENKVAMWLTQGQVPSYRTINRFRVEDAMETIVLEMFSKLRSQLAANGLIDEVIFIDGTKVSANANKYSFAWRKNIIRYSELNREKATALLREIKEAQVNFFQQDQELSFDDMDEVIARLEKVIDQLDQEVEETKRVSPNPAKKARRTAKSQMRKLNNISDKDKEYQEQLEILGSRNSYSKTDTDATFMRLKEDPMNNGQTKPAYNVQAAVSNQMVVDFDVFQNPTDTKTLIPFVEKMVETGALGSVVVADMGYGSEANYRYFEDNLPDVTPLIPYSTMLREESRKWKSDDSKVMNWNYDEIRDEYIDNNGVVFAFHQYSTRTDKSGFTRDFKVYRAETKDENNQLISASLTKSGQPRQISINPAWEYYKGKMRESLSDQNNSAIYARRKIENEPVFGRMKVHFGVTRFMVRGLKAVKNELGLVMMAMNMTKMALTVG